ncbi:prophage protein [Escherichia coli]|nr:prophage protein [Escherichia coli]
MKQEDFSDITATAKHQFRDQYAREGYQLQNFLQLRPTSTHTMAGDTIKLFST